MIAALLGLLGMVTAAGSAPHAREVAEPEPCYDTVVLAKVVEQTPSQFPKPDGEWITISWPWFVELQVDRVLTGDAKPGRMVVLAVLHMGMDTTRRRRIWLRHNDQGGFNLIQSRKRRRCAAGTPLPRPHIWSRTQTFDELLRDAKESYRRASE